MNKRRPGNVLAMPTVGEAWSKLSWRQRFLVRWLRAWVSIGEFLPSSKWQVSVEVFIFKCQNCGQLDLGYKHGHWKFSNCKDALSDE